MSVKSRQEYLLTMRQRYRNASGRAAKSALISEVTETLGYHRKYAISVLRQSKTPSRPKARRQRPRKYMESLPAIQLVWEALDYPCAERLHPVLAETAAQLAAHGELTLTAEVQQQLTQISRATLARRLARMSSPKARRTLPRPRPASSLQREIPVAVYDWDEQRPGALEADLVEHNGGSTSGLYACTLSVVDIVTGWSRRRAVLGKGQAAVFQALDELFQAWPVPPWGLHTDNGSEFLNDHLRRYAGSRKLDFHRGRPYRKNDQAHVEQKNRQFVRDMVGYDRYETIEAVAWLNEIYDGLDRYANSFLPMRKVMAKQRRGAHVQKRYDTARTPFQRLIEAGSLDPETHQRMKEQIRTTNPLALHRHLDQLIAQGPPSSGQKAVG